MPQITSDKILESLYKSRIREFDQLKTVLELYDMEIHQKISRTDCQKLNTMVRISTNQKLRLRNFDGRINTNPISSKIEDNGEEECRSETSIAKCWRAPSQMPILFGRWVRRRVRVLIPALEGWRTTKHTAEEGWWQKCSSYCEKCATVGYHRTLSRQILQRFQGRAPEYWNQVDEYDSQEMRCVKQTSEKKQVRRLGKYKSKFLISEVPTLWNLRTDLWERLQHKSDVPAEMRGELARKIDKLKKEDKATFHSLSEEWFVLAASTIDPEEREFVVDSGASMHVVSKKDPNEAELETVRISKNPIMVVTANGVVQTKEEATVYVRALDLFVTLMLLEKHQQFSHWEHSAKTLGTVTIGRVARNHISSWKARRFIATHQIMYHSSYLVYQRVPPTSFTSPTSSSQETVTDTEIPATRRSESASEGSLARGDPLHRSAEIVNLTKKKTTKQYRVMICKVCQVGCRISGMDWLMTAFQNTEILPVLLMNYL